MEDIVRQILTLAIMAVTVRDTLSFRLTNSLEKPTMIKSASTRGQQQRQDRSTVMFDKKLNEDITEMPVGASLILECEATGKPTPTIHWLKNDIRITQGHSANVMNDQAYYEQTSHNRETPMLRLGTTKSRLDVGCLTESAIYTCVADTPFERITSQTFVNVDEAPGSQPDCSAPIGGTVPMIYMWESNRLEFEGADVQLFCRASGYPQPVTTWYDRNGVAISRQNPNYRLLRNGDLLIKNVDWLEHMGEYRCIASNANGEDEETSFLYPTLP